jgi:glycosyltransferase involved in cell wall biosynthesis
VINNYQMAGELESSVGWGRKQQQVCYVGGISAIRGIREIVEAIDLAAPGIRLNLAGEFEEKSLRDEIAGLVGWRRVDELGFLAREQVREVLSRSVAGLVTFLPEPNHLESRPNKLFEYMSAGLPVVASDFPLWRAILEGEDCGLCVDPRDPRAIAAAIDRLIGDPEMAARMGENGRRAVREHYNWAAEEKKLLELYRQLTQKVGANERAG